MKIVVLPWIVHVISWFHSLILQTLYLLLNNSKTSAKTSDTISQVTQRVLRWREVEQLTMAQVLTGYNKKCESRTWILAFIGGAWVIHQGPALLQFNSWESLFVVSFAQLLSCWSCIDSTVVKPWPSEAPCLTSGIVSQVYAMHRAKDGYLHPDVWADQSRLARHSTPLCGEKQIPLHLQYADSMNKEKRKEGLL